MGMTRDQKKAELLRIKAAHGGVLDAEDVITAARDEASPLHDVFEWDNSLAAHQHRLEQARTLIRGVELVIVTTITDVPIPAYVQDPDLEQGYVLVTELQTDAGRAERALQAELQRVTSSAARARNIALGLQLEGEIDERIARAAGLPRAAKVDLVQTATR